MSNLRTHMWLCFTLGIFLAVAMIIGYPVLLSMSQSGHSIPLDSQVIHIFYFNAGVYMAYFMIVLFKAIKYVPEPA